MKVLVKQIAVQIVCSDLKDPVSDKEIKEAVESTFHLCGDITVQVLRQGKWVKNG